MYKSLLALLALAALVSDCFAISCYMRDRNTPEGSNGTQFTCTSGSTCNSRTFLNIRAASCDTCTTYLADCYVCNTDYCNTLTPSSISCFDREGTNITTNGTERFCHTGVTSCYSYVKDSLFYGSCGICSTQAPADNCTICNTSFCNTVPPIISCYNRTGANANSTNNGNTVTCAPGNTFCHYYTTGTSLYANCGTCTAAQVSSFGCTTCSGANCNAVPVSTISCYSRTGSASSSNGTMTACDPGISSCHFYEDRSSSYAACGNCTTMQVSNFGCTSCNSSSCNYKRMSNSGPLVGANIMTAFCGIILLALMRFY